jgi:hypothetical protein
MTKRRKRLCRLPLKLVGVIHQIDIVIEVKLTVS